MRFLIALILAACVIGIAVGIEYCGELPGCGEGQCCKGSNYHRVCMPLSGDGEPCERHNNAEAYSVACPCQEGLICSVINRCQRP